MPRSGCPLEREASALGHVSGPPWGVSGRTDTDGVAPAIGDFCTPDTHFVNVDIYTQFITQLG